MFEIKVISDEETAKSLWNKLSPQESIYDLWDFRYCFYQNDPQPLYFYVAYDNDQAVALLPLQFNRTLACLEFFAENFTEDNRPFFAPGYEYLLPQLFNQEFKQTVKIYDLKGDDEFTKALPLEDYIYFLEVSDFSSFEDYLLKSFKDRKKRAKFKRIATLLEEEHQVETIFNDQNDLELIMDLNVKNFREESYLRTEEERRSFRELVKLPLNWQIITIKVDGVKLASSLSVIHRDTYFYFIAGADLNVYPSLFKYLTRVNLELALKNKVKIFDCSLGDCNWKSHWHLARRPQYKFIKLIN